MMEMLLRRSSNLIKAFAFPSRTLTTNPPPKDTLFKRLLAIKTHNASILPVLDGWFHHQRYIDEIELQKIVRQFRKFARYKQALEISKWMINSKSLDESPRHLAVHLDLIWKAHGIKQAEEYFNTIPESSRVLHVYGALLNCYVNAESVEKAETVMQKIKQFKSTTPLAYNCMLRLYSQTEDYKKFDSLVEEMNNERVLSDIFTITIRLNAYAASSDISRMENLFKEMGADTKIEITWKTYINAANGYLKAGLKEKALEMLEKSEAAEIPYCSRKFAYELLMTTYTAMGNKEDVYRIWGLSKNMRKMYNTSYLCVMSSLDKLDDVDGAEKVFKEWEEKQRAFDIRIPNLMISAYCKRGLLEKGEMVIKRLEEGENKPNGSTWNHMAVGYMLMDRKEEMVETLKKVIMVGRADWKPNLDLLSCCFEYLKEKGDAKNLEEIETLIEGSGHVCSEICKKIAKKRENQMKIFKGKEEEDAV